MAGRHGSRRRQAVLPPATRVSRTRLRQVQSANYRPETRAPGFSAQKDTKMKSSIATSFTCAALALLMAACATTGPRGAPAIVDAEQFTVESEVVAIDQATRRVTLRNSEGQVTSGVVGPGVKNLSQVTVGDRVRMQYSRELNVVLKSRSGASFTEVAGGAARAAPGALPGAVAGSEIHFVADITKIDPSTGRITVRGASGRVYDVVLKNADVLRGYVPGDQVEGTFAETLAIVVVSPAAKK